MNVLSLFDGMSCGQQALDRIDIKVDNYYACEIDKYAIKVTQANYPNTIQLGSVVDLDVSTLPPIDMLIGGSPCQSFSFAGKRKGMATKGEEIEILTLEHYLQLKKDGYEFEGQSYLFWEYMRILKALKPKYFLLENVMMGEKWERVLSKAIGVNPIEINSALVSAQNRRRLYWTNIGMVPAGLFGHLESIIEQPKDKGLLLKDILEPVVDKKYYLSDKMLAGFALHKQRMQERGNGFIFNPTEGYKKGVSLPTHNGSRPTDNFIMQINPSLESGNKQPYQQNRVYDTDGICPALCHNKSDLLVFNKRLHDNLKEHNDKTNTLLSTCYKGAQANGMTLVFGLNYRKDKGFRVKKNNKSGILTARAREDESCGQLVCHNTMPRSSTTGKGGTGPLSRNDGKTYCLDTGNTNALEMSDSIRRLTPIECERLQTVNDNYTNHVSDSQRYKMLGNGWTVDVIAHIFSHLEC